MEKAYGAVNSAIQGQDQSELIEQLEQALLGGKIIAYAQGFSVLKAASEENDWNLPMDTIAEIWREGCIIRSVMLDDIADAFRSEPDLESLLLAPDFVTRMKSASLPLRQTVALAAQHALPLPALSASLSYFDYFRQGQSTANILQGQRDFFGAHGFERTDKDGKDYHGPWAMG